MKTRTEKKWNSLKCFLNYPLINHLCNLLVLIGAGYCTVSQLNPEERGKINRNYEKIKNNVKDLTAKQKCLYHLLGKVKFNNEEDNILIKRIINKINFRSPDFIMEQVDNRQAVQKGGRGLAADQFKDPQDENCLKLIESPPPTGGFEPLNFKNE